MRLPSALRLARAKASRRAKPAAPRPLRWFNPRLESLEDRVVPSTIVFDPDGSGSNFTPIPDVNTFEWLPGNTLAVGGVAAINDFLGPDGIAPGDPGDTGDGVITPFQAVSQSHLGGVLALSGQVDLPGLNGIPPDASPFEITLVSSFAEKVTDVNNNIPDSGPKASFVYDSTSDLPNFFEIYFQDGTNASDLAGTGFNDGTLILRAQVVAASSSFRVTGGGAGTPLDNFGSDDYPEIDSVEGLGSTNINAEVTYFDPAFFPVAPLTLELTRFNANDALPFHEVDPSARFVFAPDGAAPVLAGAGETEGMSIGSINGVDGPDIQLQDDANMSFTTAEQPPPPGGLIVPTTTSFDQYLAFLEGGDDPSDDDGFADGGFNAATDQDDIITRVSDPGRAFFMGIFAAPDNNDQILQVQLLQDGGDNDLGANPEMIISGAQFLGVNEVAPGDFEVVDLIQNFKLDSTDPVVTLYGPDLNVDLASFDFIGVRFGQIVGNSIKDQYAPEDYTLTFELQVDYGDGGGFMTVTTADVEVLVTQKLQLAGAAAVNPAGGPLSSKDLQTAFNQAIGTWQAEGFDTATLNGLSLSIRDLPDGDLGYQFGNSIVIDSNAAGFGWDVSGGQVDLVHTLTHELGHALGMPDVYDAGNSQSIMYGLLAPGTSRVLAAADSSPTLPGRGPTEVIGNASVSLTFQTPALASVAKPLSQGTDLAGAFTVAQAESTAVAPAIVQAVSTAVAPSATPMDSLRLVSPQSPSPFTATAPATQTSGLAAAFIVAQSESSAMPPAAVLSTEQTTAAALPTEGATLPVAAPQSGSQRLAPHALRPGGAQVNSAAIDRLFGETGAALPAGSREDLPAEEEAPPAEGGSLPDNASNLLFEGEGAALPQTVIDRLLAGEETGLPDEAAIDQVLGDEEGHLLFEEGPAAETTGVAVAAALVGVGYSLGHWRNNRNGRSGNRKEEESQLDLRQIGS
jgi:hypothetical protein